MGLNAREVVRVFACSTQLSFNLSKQRYNLMLEPIKKTALSLQHEMDQMKNAFRSVRDIVAPLELEIENMEEVATMKEQNNDLDVHFKTWLRPSEIETKYLNMPEKSVEDHFQKLYEKKLEYRCEYELTQAKKVCIEAFSLAYDTCCNNVRHANAWLLCWPLRFKYACNFLNLLHKGDTCDSREKMERSKYVDIYSMSYVRTQHSKLVTQILKVMLEVVTATTFVMLDRLFYEALDVVRQHAHLEFVHQGTQDLKIEVEGIGLLANLLRKLINNLSSTRDSRRVMTNKLCVPQPRAMPPIYFLKIYGGYVWILLLLYINPYTLRLRRKAIQAVRAHYLSGENLLSLRMKFPYLLGWLDALPAARMTCLICGETEPRTGRRTPGRWHCCTVPTCPFVYCAECWEDAGGHCLACDPSLNELSDVDSLSDDDLLRY
ncbi:hypothetical protein HF086_017762 [Spodoptera exigua]|uniref:Dendritic cell-specific transmembrane protein-like domain-containing protein n=1 Tax=Spodoptera exigua TaxID=7107 RepID=A0A922MA86_SPOEX|nr:hypothetical protein HF086_017762 [Spodoptera exigua]